MQPSPATLPTAPPPRLLDEIERQLLSRDFLYENPLAYRDGVKATILTLREAWERSSASQL